AHHIQHWAHGGQTNLDNLVLVCTSCHHNIHDNGWQITQNQDGRYNLHPPPKPYADMPTSQPCNPHPKTKTKKKPSGQPPHPKQPNRPTNPTGPTNTNTKTNRQPVLCN
ncbi:MAG: HNH endonuclease, partial [bacterium]|nr:HNH endonuclease [bacterium]